jgi:Pyruvate/2-oxoacid:ferredoxin oxidoreductase delta subunit
MEPSIRFVKLLERLFPQRFKIAKLTKLPVARWIVSKMLFEKNNLTYLPKDNLVEISLNKEIEPVDSIVVPSSIVDYFIDQSSYRVVMNFCICREAMQCSNHSMHLGCLFMGEAVRKIPKNLGKSVSKTEAKEHVHQCRNEGLVHLIGRDKLDETWLGVGSKTPLLTVCNCCTCCCLWRMLPVLDQSLASTVKKMPGIKIHINDQCTECGICTKDICFIDNIHIKDGSAVIGENCVGCSRCIDICPQKAITLTIENSNFIEKTIERVKKATS